MRLPSPRPPRTWAPAPIIYVDSDARIDVRAGDRMVTVWIADAKNIAVVSLHLSPAVLRTLTAELLQVQPDMAATDGAA